MENGVEKTMDTCTRRPHKKSRNGCGRCKKRKIKCDERKPVCTNCAKHSVVCDLTQRHSTTPWSSPAPFSPFASTSPHDSHSTAQTPYSTGERIEDGQEIPALNMLDLELLHHFCTSTCRTFHGDSTLKTIWQINAPKIAFSHDFVMRGILALSALHLAKFKPDRREFLLSHATAYHQLALRKATAVLPHKTDENCSALYLFSSLVFIFALGSPKDSADFLVISNSGIADWLVLFRGSRFLIESSHAVLEKGPLGLMFIEGAKRAMLMEQLSQHKMPLDEQINELRRLVEKGSTPEEFEVYGKSIDDLRKSYCIIYSRESPGIEIADVFIWVFRITDEYLLLLHERKQEALVIFAYFCVILKRLEGSWWVHGWSDHLMARIHHVLDEEHRLWIRWPMEEIGWVPA